MFLDPGFSGGKRGSCPAKPAISWQRRSLIASTSSFPVEPAAVRRRCQCPFRLHPGWGTRRHHRGRRRTATAPGTRHPLEARPANLEGKGEVSVRDLLRNTLRMRPDRIIVGEVRGGEALDMLQAMNTGHEGSLSTIHANSPPRGLVPPGDHGLYGRHRSFSHLYHRADKILHRPNPARGEGARWGQAPGGDLPHRPERSIETCCLRRMCWVETGRSRRFRIPAEGIRSRRHARDTPRRSIVFAGLEEVGPS